MLYVFFADWPQSLPYAYVYHVNSFCITHSNKTTNDLCFPEFFIGIRGFRGKTKRFRVIRRKFYSIHHIRIETVHGKSSSQASQRTNKQIKLIIIAGEMEWNDEWKKIEHNKRKKKVWWYTGQLLRSPLFARSHAHKHGKLSVVCRSVL